LSTKVIIKYQISNVFVILAYFKEVINIGVMSGTSLDGVDLAHIDFTKIINGDLKSYTLKPYPTPLTG
jgi:hypothetical protein